MAKTKIPKRIAGVKLNKKLRKRGNELLALADTPQGRETIAMGLSMAAAAASVALRKRSDPGCAPAAPHAAQDVAGRPAPPPTPNPPTPTPPPPSGDRPAPPMPPIDADKIIAAVGQTLETAMGKFFAKQGKPRTDG